MKRMLLFLVPAMAMSFAGHALAADPSGVINAEPNPCRIKPGEKECTTHLTWTTQNVKHARVMVKSEGKEGEKVREFSGSLSCESQRCPAPWIRYYPLDALPPNWSTAYRAHTIVPKVSACR